MAFVDTAALSIVLLSVVTVPIIFSIAQADVFALPKTVLTVVLAVALAALLTVRWISAGLPARRPRTLLGAARRVPGLEHRRGVVRDRPDPGDRR